MQCIEPKEVWEAYNEDAEDPDCLFGTKHGRWKGLGGAWGSVGAACVAAPGAGVCVRASGEEEGLGLDNTNFRKFPLKKQAERPKHWRC